MWWDNAIVRHSYFEAGIKKKTVASFVSMSNGVANEGLFQDVLWLLWQRFVRFTKFDLAWYYFGASIGAGCPVTVTLKASNQVNAIDF